MDSTDKEKFFHGEFYSEGPWNSTTAVCCSLCKTKNRENKYRHWAKGLCRSCYRRLSVTHRLYNDRWNLVNSGKDETGFNNKKYYKQISTEKIIFDATDISTLLDRYGWCCAYSRVPLQGYDYKAKNAFQLEYVLVADGVMLVPVCRAVNCSKKGLNSEEQLERWAYSKGIDYPFPYITVEDYLSSI